MEISKQAVHVIDYEIADETLSKLIGKVLHIKLTENQIRADMNTGDMFGEDPVKWQKGPRGIGLQQERECS